MPAIKSLEQLKRMCEETLEKKQTDVNRGTIQVIVTMGTCGIAVGAGDTLKSILNYIETEKVSGVTVKLVGCIGLCQQEPILQIVFGDQSRVMYGRVDAQVAQKIMKQHVRDGQPVEEHIISK